MKNSVCPDSEWYPKADFFPKAEFSEVSELWIQHTTMIIVKWHLLNFSKAEFVRNILPNVPKCGLNTSHDNREVDHLFIWHERKLCARTNAPPVQSTQNGSMTMNVYFHANCSAAQVYVPAP